MQNWKKEWICACTVAHLVVEIQAMIYIAAKVRRLSTIFQVDTCKTKKERIAHVGYSWAKQWFIMRQGSGASLQNCKSIHAKVKKIDLRKCTVAHLVVEIRAMIYNVARVRKLFAKFQVDTCKTKKDTSVHAQLHTLQLRSKTWFIMCQESGGYLQNLKSIHAKVKKIDPRMRSCTPCSWDPSHDL